MKTEQNQLGQKIGTTSRGLSPIARAAKAVVQTTSSYLNTDYGNTAVGDLGVGGPSFHNPATEGVEHGRM